MPRRTNPGTESVVEEMQVDDIEVRALFRHAMAISSSWTMRQGIELLLGLSDGDGLSTEREYAVRHPDYVMEDAAVKRTNPRA